MSRLGREWQVIFILKTNRRIMNWSVIRLYSPFQSRYSSKRKVEITTQTSVHPRKLEHRNYEAHHSKYTLLNNTKLSWITNWRFKIWKREKNKNSKHLKCNKMQRRRDKSVRKQKENERSWQWKSKKNSKNLSGDG